MLKHTRYTIRLLTTKRPICSTITHIKLAHNGVFAYTKPPTITTKISPHTYLYVYLHPEIKHIFRRRRRRREVNDSRIDRVYNLNLKRINPRQSEEQPLSRPHIGNFKSPINDTYIHTLLVVMVCLAAANDNHTVAH